jgi:hypothetical protein
MIHFDIPWSLMVFQQRNGRIDRYGQQRQPQIRYLLTESENPRVRGDLRVLEVLIEKDGQAGKNIGDPSEFMGKFNPEAEEAITAAAIELDKTDADDISDIFAGLLDGANESTDLVAKFTPDTAPSNNFDGVLQHTPRLYADDISYAGEALRWLQEQGVELQADIEGDMLRITAPNDLVQRLRYLPHEVRPNHDRFILTNNKQRIFTELKRCREEDSPWPDIQYLWELHPVMEWFADRALNAFGRHTAPILRLNTLPANEHIVLIYGGFPNKRGQILVHDWLAVCFQDQTQQGVKTLDEILSQLQLKTGKLANRGLAGDTEILQQLLPLAIPPAKQALQKLRQKTQSKLAERLLNQLDKLKALKSQHILQLELDFGDSEQPEAIKKTRREDRRKHIEQVFQDHIDWLHNTQTTEPEPFIQVAAVFTGQAAG